MSLDPLWGLYRNRELIREMAVRDAKGINKGSALGNSWLVLRPLIQTAAYVVIVSFVFRSRMAEDSGPLDYAIFVLAGMVPWQVLAQSLVTAPALVHNHAALVKQVVYPIETLPLRSLVVGSFSSLVSLSAYLLLSAWVGQLKWTVLLLPIPLLLLASFIVGLSWIFMVAGVYLRDFREIIGASMNLLIFLSPVIVDQSMVSPRVWGYVLWNPLSHVVLCFRDVCDAQIHPTSWCVNVSMTLAVTAIGATVLSAARMRIKDYL